MMAYLDSSVALRHILMGEIAIEQAFASHFPVASELIEIECRRVLHRCRMGGELDDDRLVIALERLEAVIAGLDLVELSPSIKQRAMEAFPVIVRTLDALHLATALECRAKSAGEEILVFSHDRGMNNCARALGFGTPLAVN
jgi:predicted nucleic acid-binding protein